MLRPTVFEEHLRQIKALAPAGFLEHRARIEGGHLTDAQDAQRMGAWRQVKQFAESCLGQGR